METENIAGQTIGDSERAVVTDAVLKALTELVDSQRGPFPGAIGRAGTRLVRLGLARNCGRVTFSGSYRNDCRPDVYTQFELTEAGRKALEDRSR